VTTPPAPAPQFPPGRYGRRRQARSAARRWWTYALAAFVVVAGTGIAVKLYRQYALAPYQVTVLSVTDIGDHQVTVTFEVRKPAGESALCTVRARNRAGAEVGRAEVQVPAGAAEETRSRVTYTLRTTERPVTGEVPGCGPAT
jgi:Domain of unknown function (DUF4307)